MSQAEDIFERADGTPLPVHVVGSPVREGGEVKGAVLFFADQRQRAALEEQLRQAQKMEVVGRLAGGVAHDFNNLLTAILGYGEILRDQLGPGRSPRELDEMIKGAHRAAALTRQLLTFSRREPYAPRVLDPNALVLGMEKLLRRVIGEDVTLTIDLGGHVGNIRMDASGFEQVILNLAVNARDAMPRGGQLTITTRAGADNLVEIVVADSGPGIDEATAARIFEPFFTTKATGTGLGLAIVRDIVEGAGGHIRLASPPGAGATFGVQLPRTSEALEPTSELPAGLGAGSGTVLLVEDDALVRSFARRALEAGGYDVVEAVDADDAEACADAFIGTIHLLLSDIVLPGRSGPELAARLARTRPTLRVLFMSGYAPGGGASVPEGATVVQKPFSGRVLAARVRETLDR
jgi:nitrogen-specific signal transduction histidine kinase/CheY-like chemotaxis protein